MEQPSSWQEKCTLHTSNVPLLLVNLHTVLYSLLLLSFCKYSPSVVREEPGGNHISTINIEAQQNSQSKAIQYSLVMLHVATKDSLIKYFKTFIVFMALLQCVVQGFDIYPSNIQHIYIYISKIDKIFAVATLSFTLLLYSLYWYGTERFSFPNQHCNLSGPHLWFIYISKFHLTKCRYL